MIRERIQEFRTIMRKKGMDYFIIFTADPHLSEYINDYYKQREYLSGFTGSNGLLLIGPKEGLLWTDGRYFVQAEKELHNSGLKLMKMNTPGYPSLIEYLSNTMEEGSTLGFDGMLVPAVEGNRLADLMKSKEGKLIFEETPVDLLWGKERPNDSASVSYCLPESITGKSAKEKIEDVFTEMERYGADSYFLSKLDDQMWLFNLRGSDIACNPVFYAYTLFLERKVYLFVKDETLTAQVKEKLDDLDVCCLPYHRVTELLPELLQEKKDSFIMLDRSATNYRLEQICLQLREPIFLTNPTEKWKAVKNEVEIQNIKETYLKDSLAMTRFLYWIKKEILSRAVHSECSVANYLDNLRRNIDGFLDFSFPTISAYNANAAMMHYEPVPGKDAILKQEGILLVDSGGQYLGGTTDVTRSIVLGEIGDEIKKQYTHVCTGMLRLMNAVFLDGCTGRNLDILAREPMWELFLDYKCGTGHGIGYILNVHEGPHNISWQKRSKDEPLIPGMIVSDEPGVYVADSHGIRLETILLCTKKGESPDGVFLGFEPLTFVPIDLEGIDPEEMEEKDLALLNQYHESVYAKLSEYMDDDEKKWLREMTKSIKKSAI
ncbi:MAG: aminopeptidase P family protein [Lachnospiraceae bacterium]